MLKLSQFDRAAFQRYPGVEEIAGDIVPMLAQVKLAPPDYQGRSATVVVDGNGIQVMIYNKKDKEAEIIFCRKLHPFPLAVFIAEHLEEPLDLQVLTKFGFKGFKLAPNRGRQCWLPLPFG
jgi:hypothetical protein